MTAEQDINCCTSLSGIYNESTNTCEMGNLGARKYNFTYPCSYVDKYEKGIEESGIPKSIANMCYVVGATTAYFIPSSSKYKVYKDIPPPLDSYHKRVESQTTLGLVVSLVILVATIFLIKRIIR